MAKKRSNKNIQVNSVKHNDKRKNIPTEELRDFVREQESKPEQVKYAGLLYARDPSLDPQLVWKGKDEQDQEELTVPAVPIYIQEKIHPQAIIEEVRAQSKTEHPEPQMELFSDFNGIDFEELVDFYHHDANWSNRMILGDSLMVMASLAEKEGLKNTVQMIYIDPPYGVEFNSNWQVSTRKRGVQDGKVADATRQPEQIRAFRDTWKLGIHSYLSYWRDRLIAARELLTETGSVFVQIGDVNVHLVRSIMDEVFGSENFICQISVQKTGGLVKDFLPRTHDIILWYGKDRKTTKYRQLYLQRSEQPCDYQYILLANGQQRNLTADERNGTVPIPKNARLYSTTSMESENPVVEFSYRGRVYRQRWKTNLDGLRRLSSILSLIN